MWSCSQRRWINSFFSSSMFCSIEPEVSTRKMHDFSTTVPNTRLLPTIPASQHSTANDWCDDSSTATSQPQVQLVWNQAVSFHADILMNCLRQPTCSIWPCYTYITLCTSVCISSVASVSFEPNARDLHNLLIATTSDISSTACYSNRLN